MLLSEIQKLVSNIYEAVDVLTQTCRLSNVMPRTITFNIKNVSGNVRQSVFVGVFEQPTNCRQWLIGLLNVLLCKVVYQ